MTTIDKYSDSFAFMTTGDNPSSTETSTIQPLQAWKVLIVDTDDTLETLAANTFVDQSFHDRQIEIITASSSAQTKTQLQQHPDCALILMNINLELDQAGFSVVQFIRNELDNQFLRIILFSASEEQVAEHGFIASYDFDDLRLKADLSPDHLYTMVVTNLRTYEKMIGTESLRCLLVEQLKTRTKKLATQQTAFLKLKKAIETTELGITITDNHGRIAYANSADAQMHGYTVEELIGQPANIYARPEIRKSFNVEKPDFKAYMNWKRESTNIRKDGSEFPVTLISNMIKNLEGNPIGMVVVCENITERKQAEMALKKSEQHLRELNATKDKFFSIIAHDLRNPLTTLLGYSDLILQIYETTSSEEIYEMLGKLNGSANQLHKLIENLFQWSRAQIDGLNFEPAMISLHQIVKTNVDLFKFTAIKKDIILHTTVFEELEVFADQNMITTVIRNLISNGLKFTDRGGSVTISTTIDDGEVTIRVRDTGVGIDLKNIPSLFLLNESCSTPGTEQEVGTGLGLILCKEFVEINGGTIRVESKQKIGSTFSFTLPLNQPADSSNLD
jgi:PAS domain S-box-containing protein